MNNLLHKEFNLSINRFFVILMPLFTGALFLIPQWPYFIAMMYFFFISVPTLSSSYNSQKDNEFSMIMPVRKTDVVKARIAAFCIIELIHIAFGVIFAVIHHILYKFDNFMLNLNPAFFGVAFTMFGIFNIIFFSMYYKSAYFFGIPTIVATVVTVLYITGIELSAIFMDSVRSFFANPAIGIQLAVLIGGLAVFVIFNLLTVKIASARFEKVDI